MSFPAYQPVSGCGDDGDGATHMLYWLDRESPWRDVGFNLGVCACRRVAGKAVTSQHARCRAWDLGLPLVNGRANPVGHQIVAALLPHVAQLGITEIIWNRTRWSASAPRGAPYRGVSPHYDHIHAAHTLTATRLLNVPTIRAVMAGAAAPQRPPAPPAPAPAPAPLPAPSPDMEDDDDMAQHFRLNAPGNPHHGRVECVGNFFRRWVSPDEYALLVRLRTPVVDLNLPDWNAATSNKAVVDAGRVVSKL